MNIKILTAYHRKSELITTDIIKPIQVGTDINGVICPQHLHDNTGDNISGKNGMYCELTAQYWAWKNLDADYYGFMHYRRYFAFDCAELLKNELDDVLLPHLTPSALKTLHLTDDELEKTVAAYDVITAEPYDVKKTGFSTVYKQYKANHKIKDLDLVLDIISEKHPEFRPSADKYLSSRMLCHANMYIMKKQLFFDYCEWLFDILAEYERRGEYKDYSLYQYRVCGFLAERLWGVYLTWLKENKNLRVLEAPVCFFENTDENTPVTPAFAENNVPVVLAANDAYVPYLAVALKSLVENTSRERNYDIIVLHADITEENQARLTRELVHAENISLRFKNVTPVFDEYVKLDLRVVDQISKETYFRFLIQDIMPDYDKVVYIDSNLIFLADVAELYDTPMGTNLLAAVRDADSAGAFNELYPDYKQYQLEKMKLENPFDYLNAGVLLINLAEMRKSFTVQEIMKFAASEKWHFLDQDVLNMLCEGRVTFLDMAWNVMMDWKIGTMSRMDAIVHAPHWLYLDYLHSRNAPKIVHYAGIQKPWKCANCDFAEYFWQYARMTSFYEPLVAYSNANCAGSGVAGSGKVGGIKEPVYSDGLYVKLINRLNRIFPKGTRRRALVKHIAGVFIR